MFDIFFLQQDIEPQTSPADTSLCMNVTSVVKRSERRVDWSPFIRNAADLIPAYWLIDESTKVHGDADKCLVLSEQESTTMRYLIHHHGRLKKTAVSHNWDAGTREMNSNYLFILIKNNSSSCSGRLTHGSLSGRCGSECVMWGKCQNKNFAFWFRNSELVNDNNDDNDDDNEWGFTFTLTVCVKSNGRNTTTRHSPLSGEFILCGDNEISFPIPPPPTNEVTSGDLGRVSPEDPGATSTIVPL